MKIGDRVRDLRHHVGMTGTVFELQPEDPTDPLVRHGYINVRLDPIHIGKFNCMPEDEEHYVHYNWQEFLEVITETAWEVRPQSSESGVHLGYVIRWKEGERQMESKELWQNEGVAQEEMRTWARFPWLASGSEEEG